MTPSGFVKSKTAFSIESLVGRGSSPTPSDSPECIESPLSKSTALEPFFSKTFLNLQENSSVIRRPQPVNGAIHNSQNNFELQLPASYQATKDFGAIPNLLLNSPLAFASLPQLHGLSLPFSSQLHPLLGGLPGLGTSIPREFSPYPWMPSRHGRMFPHGLTSHEQLAYFLQPFRKSKRIRTAFSPSQLLKLEQAFEKNQYVVGVERKHLAQNLNLSETQVKVWFQNRRTKEKKVQPDDDDVMDQDRNKINEKMDEDDDEGGEEDDGAEEALGSSYKTKIVNQNHLTESSEMISEAAKINKLVSDNKVSDCKSSTSIHTDNSYSLISSTHCDSPNIDALADVDS